MGKEDHIEMVNIAMKLMDRIMIRTMSDMSVAEDGTIEIENVMIIIDITTIDITDRRNMNVITETTEVSKISTTEVLSITISELTFIYV